jgi:hypothetical protein
MALPAAWIESLFARLTTRYGVAFQRVYADMDIEVVKADWAIALDRIPGAAIKGALENLPDKPPHAGQFRKLCLDSMPSDANRVFVALPAPKVDLPDGLRSRLNAAMGRPA